MTFFFLFVLHKVVGYKCCEENGRNRKITFSFLFELHRVVGYKKVIAERYNTKELDPSGKFNPNIRMFLLKVKEDNVDELMRLLTQVNDTMTSGAHKSSLGQRLMELRRTLRSLTQTTVDKVFDDQIGTNNLYNI
jgi:hypothetical protein